VPRNSCACWRLLGVGARLLDKGELDGLREREHDAQAEMLVQLSGFALHGRDEQRSEWWAKRTAAADMEMRFRVEPRLNP
jgi:hypothetical protein